MLYNIFLGNFAYLCSENKGITNEDMFNRSRNAGAQNQTIMEKNVNEILRLKYQIKRYRTMRNGAMCQLLNGKLQKLLAQQALA